MSEVEDIHQKLPVGATFSTDVVVEGQPVTRWFVVTAHTESGVMLKPIDGRREMPVQL